MINFDYLQHAIFGLANAHRAGTMAGHLGAAVAAGYFFGEDHSDLEDAVFRGVEGELDRVLAGEEAIWFNVKKTGIKPTDLFKAIPNGEVVENANQAIVEALGKSVGGLRQSGHNVIFASLAIRALRDHQEFATPMVVEGICKLIKGFHGVSAGRGYYGKKAGWRRGQDVKLDSAQDFPAYRGIGEMVQITLQEVIDSASVRRQGFGGLWHLINHAAGIVDLERSGFGVLASKALSAHHLHVRLWRSLPDVEKELGKNEKARCSPLEAEYWKGMLKRDQARLTHRIKTMYGFQVIKEVNDRDQLEKEADAAFLYLMS